MKNEKVNLCVNIYMYINENKYFSDVAILINAMLNILGAKAIC